MVKIQMPLDPYSSGLIRDAKEQNSPGSSDVDVTVTGKSFGTKPQHFNT